jgi:hypothetical protein
MTDGLTEAQRAALTDEELRVLEESGEEPLGQEDIDEPPNSADDFPMEATDAAIVNDDPVTQKIITDDDFTDEDVKALDREGGVS